MITLLASAATTSRRSHDLPPPEFAWMRSRVSTSVGKSSSQLPTADDLPNDHRRFRPDLLVTAAGAASSRRLSKKSEIVTNLPALSWG